MKYYKNNRGQIIGQYREGVYRKIVTRSKHLMRNYDGYGISKDIIEDLKELNCKEVRIKEEDTGKVWTFDFIKWVDNGIEANYQGRQIFLPNSYENKTNKEVHKV